MPSENTIQERLINLTDLDESSTKNTVQVRPNNLIDLDESLMKRLNELPQYEGILDSKYCEVHEASLDIWRTLGLAGAVTWAKTAFAYSIPHKTRR